MQLLSIIILCVSHPAVRCFTEDKVEKKGTRSERDSYSPELGTARIPELGVGERTTLDMCSCVSVATENGRTFGGFAGCAALALVG